jgi:YesN/AraC family two-component response regulator
MIFYEIQLHSIPKIKFSVDVSIDNYRVCFHNYQNFLELTMILEGKTRRCYADLTVDYCEPKMFLTTTQTSDFITDAVNNEHQRHITVGVNVKYTCKKWDTNSCKDIERIKNDVVEKGLLLVPDMVMMGKYENEVRNILKKISYSYSSKDPHRSSYALAYWYRLTALLTDYVLSEIEQTTSFVPPGSSIYVERAKCYIEDHYREKIRIVEIADILGISEGYLYDIFKKVTGLTVLQYINQHRINIFKQYVENYHFSLADAALQVGIEDPAYMSRLFKKVTGVSFREYFSK